MWQIFKRISPLQYAQRDLDNALQEIAALSEAKRSIQRIIAEQVSIAERAERTIMELRNGN